MIANHAAALLQVSSNALSKLVPLQNVDQKNTKSEHTKLMPVALLHAVLLVHQTSAQNANKPKNQHVNVTKMLSALQLIQTAVVTLTTANATRTSASILLKKLAQLDTLELLSILVLVVQLLNVAMSKPLQQQLQLLQPQQLLQLPILQSPISHHLHHTPFVSILTETNDVMEKPGLFHLNHAQLTLVMLSMTSEPPSVSAVTNELDAAPTNVKLLTSSMNAVLSTLANQLDVKRLPAQKLFQNVKSTKT